MALTSIKTTGDKIEIVNQLLLPHTTEFIDIDTIEQAYDAIKSMKVSDTDSAFPGWLYSLQFPLSDSGCPGDRVARCVDDSLAPLASTASAACASLALIARCLGCIHHSKV